MKIKETMDGFSVLDCIDSTNNYAMAKLHEGLATHGMAWFAKEQTQGKGQRGKQWVSSPGENLALSIIIQPPAVFLQNPFVFNAYIANNCHNFFFGFTGQGLTIKWPNDLYVGDRKAGGILIENIYQGKDWKWAVFGIGFNINQIEFPPELNACSLRSVTGKVYDPIEIAKDLHKFIMLQMSVPSIPVSKDIIEKYNHNLYRRGFKVRLRRQNVVFETLVNEVNLHGQLLTTDSMPRQFEFGEVEWVL